MAQRSIQSALTCIEESYCVGDVIIASTAVIGKGVVLRADPGCSITIRDGVCLGAGVIIHASQGAIELHQGVCLAGGVLIIGQGQLGRQVCVGAGATLINPSLPDAAMIAANCLWGDDSRPYEEIDFDVFTVDEFEEPDQTQQDSLGADGEAQSADASNWQDKSHAQENSNKSVSSKTVIGKQQFEVMLKKMFPEREAFQKARSDVP